MNWIDIKNQTPDNREVVLVSDGEVWYKAKFYKESEFTSRGFISNGRELKNITH